MPRRRWFATTLLILTLTGLSGGLTEARAQERALPPDLARAQDVRNEFRRLLDRYPPELGRVLKLDPSLMSNEAYMAPYPEVAAFIGEYSEVPRYPGYFLEFVRDTAAPSQPLEPAMQLRRDGLNIWRSTIEGLTVVLGMVVVAGAFVWLVRSIVQHRRWLRALRLQSEVHGKLLERFGSSQDLLAYVQSPAGNHFLTSTPSVVGEQPAPAAPPTPLGRILWSVQAGTVLVSAGIGLLVIRGYVAVEVGEMLLTFGVLAVSLGFGFMLAAFASYSLSHRLGLVPVPGRAPDDEAHGA